MIGQNNGFARAVADGDAEVMDYRAPMISSAELTHAWAESADRSPTRWRVRILSARSGWSR
jgi:hypothetical protein